MMPRKAETYRAARRNLARVNGGLGSKTHTRNTWTPGFQVIKKKGRRK